MRDIDPTGQYRRDLKREYRGRHGKALNASLKPVLSALAADQPLPASCRDHPLTGNWRGYRECHIKPDLLLIYRKPDAETLKLERLGSHSELGLS